MNEKNTNYFKLTILVAFFLSTFSIKTIAQTNQKEETISSDHKGEYLGLKRPGLIPLKFAPGFVSSSENYEFSSTFSPNGDEFYFSRHLQKGSDLPTITRIMVTRRVDNFWTVPKPVSFSSKHKDLEPHITPDGKRMYFNSNRPLPGKTEKNRHGLWFVERIDRGWGEPQYFGTGMFVSATTDGTVYYTDVYDRKIRHGIVKRRFKEGRHLGLEKLEEKFNQFYAGHPVIDPDENFILFDAFNPKGQGSGNEMDLYVSFKGADGTWSEPINLGDSINKAGGGSGMASISPDGKYLFYSNNGDLYWVSAEIVNQLQAAK